MRIVHPNAPPPPQLSPHNSRAPSLITPCSEMSNVSPSSPCPDDALQVLKSKVENIHIVTDEENRGVLRKIDLQ